MSVSPVLWGEFSAVGGFMPPLWQDHGLVELHGFDSRAGTPSPFGMDIFPQLAAVPEAKSAEEPAPLPVPAPVAAQNAPVPAAVPVVVPVALPFVPVAMPVALPFVPVAMPVALPFVPVAEPAAVPLAVPAAVPVPVHAPVDAEPEQECTPVRAYKFTLGDQLWCRIKWKEGGADTWEIYNDVSHVHVVSRAYEAYLRGRFRV